MLLPKIMGYSSMLLHLFSLDIVVHSLCKVDISIWPISNPSTFFFFLNNPSLNNFDMDNNASRTRWRRVRVNKKHRNAVNKDDRQLSEPILFLHEKLESWDSTSWLQNWFPSYNATKFSGCLIFNFF